MSPAHYGPVGGETKVVGVFGHPVAHTLSPPMHNRAFAELGLDWIYLAFPVRPEDLADALRGAAAMGLAGVNLTIPHKVEGARLMDRLSPEAERIGAVNTVAFTPEGLVGHNTDGAGFVRSLREEAGFDPKGAKVLLLGAGGAARAIAVQLLLEGADSLLIVNRTAERAEALARSLNEWAPALVAARGLAELGADDVAERELIIHATSHGMAPGSEAPPLLEPEWLSPRHLVCDIVYTPRRTGLLRAAEARGCRVLEGLGMLAYQGAVAFELWTGRPAPAALMKQVLERHLERRGG